MAEKIRVLLTSCGHPFIPGIIECLQREKDYAFHIVGVDMQTQAVGASFVDSFHTVPAGLDPAYPEKILEVARKENIDIIVPLNDDEVLALAGQRERFVQEGITVLCSDIEAVARSSDKGKMLTFLREKGIPVPEFYLPSSLVEMDKAVELLGYPEQDIVLKPVRGSGARGFWILSEKKNGQDLILRERWLKRLPYPVVRSLLAERSALPPVVVMQYLRGPDFNIDVLAWQGKTLYCIPIQRIVPDAGPVQVGHIVHDARIDTMAEQIIAAFDFSYNINLEMAYLDETGQGNPLIYEINPRMSAPIAAHRIAGVNLVLFGILLGLNRDIPMNLPYKDITMQRCWREVYP